MNTPMNANEMVNLLKLRYSGLCDERRRLPEVEHELDALFEALAEVRT